ncbi:MAG: hypothetical protein K0R66_608 [Gammaproteobacteria bacterium]|jgi:hypothetical protein|nr:hypothetical protein [Gammaproteobacteria bacterium]
MNWKITINDRFSWQFTALENRHPRLDRGSRFEIWIPAFAGMTEPTVLGVFYVLYYAHLF